ncbi:hypothetical protein GGQ99_004802 [Aminobacter niigataensis]|uniref:Uncharacterized protein n=1 Tax=Aminobacter niigataensis TaxID=83265 RepID=A0ABR6L885_9HYPH|nr:hypothetical protein [Aminobacter niigataensis]MBB4653018.1 hypothetical protein [Aminobacter niigataensis]
MRTLGVLVILGAMGLPAQAQVVVDDSTASVGDVMLKEVVAAMSDRLSDPGSGQLRRLRMFTPVGADYEAVCGEFNAKNGYGGYVGFAPFQYLPPYKRLIMSGAGCPG